MNLLKWPGALVSGPKTSYAAVGDENESDAGSEDHLLGEKSSGPTKSSSRQGTGLFGRHGPLLWLHALILAFYSALFLAFVLSWQEKNKCADDQTMVWCKSESFLGPLSLSHPDTLHDIVMTAVPFNTHP